MSTAELLQDWDFKITFGICALLVLALMPSRFVNDKIRERRIINLEEGDDIDSAHANFTTERIKFFIVLALTIFIIILLTIVNV